MDRTNRIIYNTGVVYAQMVISAVVSLLSVRYVLQALGEEDYGVYMLVAGVIALLDILSSSMAHTSMRYMAHSLGKNDLDTSLKTFNTTLFIHYCLAAILVVVLEVGGWIMFEWFVNIPEGKLFSAKVVYQFMVVTSLVTVVSVPFDAVINSHENLLFLAVIGIAESIVGIGIALLLFIYDDDRLILYGLLMMILKIVVRIVKQVYTRTKYPECRVNFRKHRDKELMKSILSFTGWDFLNVAASMCTTQIRGILINMFFGVKLNAAEGVGKKVNSKLNQLSTGISRAITPQMNKSEGGGDRNRLIQLTFSGVKFTTFMYCLLGVPLMCEMQYVLDVWLKDVPAYTAIFCQLCILLQIISKFTWQIGNAVRAVGRIKEMQIIASVLAFMGVIIGYFVFKSGAGPVSIYLIEIFIALIGMGTNLYFGKKIVNIMPKDFICKATLPVIIPIVISLIIVLPIHYLLNEGFLRFALVFSLFIVSNFLIFWFYSMSKSERKRLTGLVVNKIHKNKANR